MNFESMPKHTMSGFVKIFEVEPSSGAQHLLVDQPNMILKAGAKIMAYALAGKLNAKIWGMYIGYNNASGSFTAPNIDENYSDPFKSSVDFGYIREPLTFEPTYLSDAGYEDNIVLFSTMVTSANETVGASLETDVSKLFEVGLVAAMDPTTAAQDLVFSRTQFNSIVYNANYNLNIVWGIKIDL